MTFNELYDAHFEQIYRFCYRYVDNDVIASDLTQDTFLKLFQRMKSSAVQIENPRAWLYKVASNLCLNNLQTTQRREVLEKNLDHGKTNADTPESILVRKESAEFIRQMLLRFKDEHRLLLLMYQDGLSYKEMSEATGIPLNSIGKTLWRNIEKLADLIKKSHHAKS